jgi:hypothetical protein
MNAKNEIAHIRGILFYWQLIDCSFGMTGIIPLSYCYQEIGHLENLLKQPAIYRISTHLIMVFNPDQKNARNFTGIFFKL